MRVMGQQFWSVEEGAFRGFVSGLVTRGAFASRDGGASGVGGGAGPAVGLFGLDVPRGRVPMLVEGGVARIRVEGMLLPERDEWMDLFGEPYTTYAEIQEEIGAAVADASVGEIVLVVCSPGGTVMGVNAAADAVYAARGVKRVRAEVQGLCASAAYYIASQAERVDATAESLVGSIGTVMRVLDWSKAAERAGIEVHVIASGALKGAFTTGAPVEERHLAVAQELVNEFAGQFYAAVERGRGRTFDAAEMYSGRCWVAGTARGLGLIDGLLGGVFMGAPGGAKASEETQEMTEQEHLAAVAAARAEGRAEGVSEGHAAGVAEGHAAGVREERERVGALAGAFEKDPAYALASAASGVSVLEAKAGYSDVLAARLEKAETALAGASKAGGVAAVPGAAGLPVDGTEGGGAGADAGMSMVNAARELAAKEGISFPAALNRLRKAQ